jgi:hypothetical protein
LWHAPVGLHFILAQLPHATKCRLAQTLAGIGTTEHILAAENFDAYTAWITPKPGDPTYPLLKAHLLFEELLRAYINKKLPHPTALEGARLTFVQVLAIAKACSENIVPSHWMWKAIGDLNKLRNMLSHEARPKDFEDRIFQYTSFVEKSLGFPLPEPDLRMQTQNSEPEKYTGRLYSGTDVVTFGLYYFSAKKLGFNTEHLE